MRLKTIAAIGVGLFLAGLTMMYIAAGGYILGYYLDLPYEAARKLFWLGMGVAGIGFLTLVASLVIGIATLVAKLFREKERSR